MNSVRYLLCVICLAPGLAWSQSQDIVGLNKQALELIRSGNSIEAEGLARQAIAVSESLPAGRAGKQRERHLPVAQQRLGLALRQQGRFAEAERILREALLGAERGHGYASQLAIKTQIHLGQALQSQGRYAEADKQLHEALVRTPEAKDDETLEIWLDVRMRLGRLQMLSGNEAEAEKLLTTVLEKSAAATEQQARRWRRPWK